MTSPTRTSCFVLRRAVEGDADRLMALYAANAGEASPKPSITPLARALGDGRLFVVASEATGELVAASATFEFLKGFHAYVGELSGTCVTGPLNGCRPLSVQRLMIALRLVVQAVYGMEPQEGTSTLISIVKDDNEASRRNVVGAGLVPIAELPNWMAYDHRSWSGGGGEGWTYYVATTETVAQAISDLDEVGLFDGLVGLRRDDRTYGGEEAIEIRCELNGMSVALAVLEDIEAGRQEFHLSPPPERLIP